MKSQYKHMAFRSKNVKALMFLAKHDIKMDADDILFIVDLPTEFVDYWISLRIPIRKDIIKVYIHRHKLINDHFCQRYKYMADMLNFPKNEDEYDVFCLSHNVV